MHSSSHGVTDWFKSMISPLLQQVCDNFSSGYQKVAKNNEEVVSLGWKDGHIRHCRDGKCYVPCMVKGTM